MSPKILTHRTDVIEKLSHDPAIKGGNLATALRKIGQAVAKILNLEEVAFWHFTQNGEILECVSAYKAGQPAPIRIKQVGVQKIKDYVVAIQNSLYTVALDSSRKVKAVRGAREFLRKEITASLHVPVYVNGALGGVVQFNKIRRARSWSLDDCIVACETTALVSDTFKRFGMMGVEKYTPSVMDTLDRSLERVLEELKLDHGMIRLDEIPVTRGYSPEVEVEFINQYRTSHALAGGNIIVRDIDLATGNWKGMVHALKSEGIQSFAAVPIILDREQVGCLHVASRTVTEWKPETISLLEWTARHVARMVSDLWIIQDGQTLNGLIQRIQINAPPMSRVMMFDEAIEAVGESAVDVLETDMAFIVLLKPDNTVDCPWISGLNSDIVNRIMDTEGAVFQSIVGQNKTPILFPNVRESILPKSLQRLLAEKNVQAARIFPFVYEGLTLGAMIGFYKQARLFTRNERSVLSLFVNSTTLTLQNAKMYNRIEQGYLNMALELARLVDGREVTLSDSSSTSARLAEEIARALRIPEEEVNRIHWAALLHDIGKKDIPDKVLQKSGPLSEDEWEMVRLSPKMGEKMLEPIPRLRGIAKIIRTYHEHYDGSGYPDKLKGNQIPIGAKVLAVSDAYTSMIDRRAYRSSLSPQDAIRQIQSSSGKYFDPIVVKAFNTVASKYVN